MSRGEVIVYSIAWIVGGCIVLGIAFAFYSSSKNSGEREERQFNNCVDNGGTWIDATDKLCVIGGKVVESK